MAIARSMISVFGISVVCGSASGLPPLAAMAERTPTERMASVQGATVQVQREGGTVVRSASAVLADGRELQRDVVVVRSKTESGSTVSRDVTTTLPDGREITRETEVVREEGTAKRETIVTGPNGGTARKTATGSRDGGEVKVERSRASAPPLRRATAATARTATKVRREEKPSSAGIQRAYQASAGAAGSASGAVEGVAVTSGSKPGMKSVATPSPFVRPQGKAPAASAMAGGSKGGGAKAAAKRK